MAEVAAVKNWPLPVPAAAQTLEALSVPLYVQHLPALYRVMRRPHRLDAARIVQERAIGLEVAGDALQFARRRPRVYVVEVIPLRRTVAGIPSAVPQRPSSPKLTQPASGFTVPQAPSLPEVTHSAPALERM